MILRAFSLLLISFSVLALVAGCSSSPKQSASRGGGYYKDDGPGLHIPKNLHAIPNAQPRIEAHAPANMRPYTVLGQSYTPITSDQAFRQTGNASWYGKKFHGRKTANGEIYDMYAMTAAHPTLPLPSYAKVTRLQTGQSVIVRINDRGPFHSNRIIDLSYVAAAKLDIIGLGTDTVVVEAITHDDIRRGMAQTDLKPIADQQMGLAQVYLQFGAFRNGESATELARHINAKVSGLEHHDAHIEPTTDAFFRVQMGPYRSREDALDAAEMIRMETGLDASLAVR